MRQPGGGGICMPECCILPPSLPPVSALQSELNAELGVGVKAAFEAQAADLQTDLQHRWGQPAPCCCHYGLLFASWVLCVEQALLCSHLSAACLILPRAMRPLPPPAGCRSGLSSWRRLCCGRGSAPAWKQVGVLGAKPLHLKGGAGQASCPALACRMLTLDCLVLLQAPPGLRPRRRPPPHTGGTPHVLAASTGPLTRCAGRPVTGCCSRVCYLPICLPTELPARLI